MVCVLVAQWVYNGVLLSYNMQYLDVVVRTRTRSRSVRKYCIYSLVEHRLAWRAASATWHSCTVVYVSRIWYLPLNLNLYADTAC